MKKSELMETLKTAGVPFEEKATLKDLQELHDKAKADGLLNKPEPKVEELKTPQPKAKVSKPKAKAGKYEVLSNLKRNGQTYVAGDKIELDKATAENLIERKVVK